MRLEHLDADEPLVDPWEGVAATLRNELEQRTGQRQQASVRRLTFRQWAERVPEPRGPLDFGRFTWQQEIYDGHAAEDREIVYMKATQCGLSTQAIRWMLYHADIHQRVGLYVFPTERELGDFSRHRIRPVLRASEWLRSRMTADAIDNVAQKQIAFGWAYFRGANKPIDAIPADCIVFDEYDSCDMGNVEASERRVTGPDSAGLIRRVGVPSIPGFGISGLYDGSDQRVWTARCESGHWNPMRGFEAFGANVDEARMVLVCSTCQRPLDVRKGEWVATWPDREVRGYHIPKLIVPGVSISTLVANSKKTRPDQVEAFHTRDLGEPYAPAEGRLSIEAIRACVRPELRPQESAPAFGAPPICMGVDMASARALNVVIEQAVDEWWTVGKKLWIGTIDTTSPSEAFQRLCWLMDAFNVAMCGIDAAPEGLWTQAFAARYPSRVYRMSFFTPQAGGRTEPPVWIPKDEEQFCSLWRTKVYDATFERFRMQRVLLPPLELLDPEYPKHLGNLYRRRVELPGDTGRERVEYVRVGPEDFGQAEAYCLTAIELYWRNTGLNALRGRGPVPLADEIEDFTGLDLTSYGEDVEQVYRPGFE